MINPQLCLIVSGLESLTDLDLRVNQLISLLLETIGHLKNLKFLDLRNNQLTSLHSSIRKLVRLEKLDLRKMWILN